MQLPSYGETELLSLIDTFGEANIWMLKDKTGLAYTTIDTMMKRLEKKNLVNRNRVSGLVYFTCPKYQEIREEAISHFAKLWKL